MTVVVFAQAAIPRDIGLFEFLFGAEYWTGAGGILTSLWDTVVLCAAVVVVATVVAVPLATALAHHGRGELSVTWIVTLSRAIPTFAVAGLLVPISLRRGLGFEPWPIFIALLLLALPPIYLNTYTAVKDVDRGVVDAARAMGFSERHVLFRVEMALGTAVILAGVRVAAVQVVATEPIRAFLGGDGLGRYVRDGLGQNNDNLLLGGAILVAALAALTGVMFGLAQRLALPAGVRRLARPRTR
ncbi:MAG: ABC transporter permease subunit [Acidimicrobiia bacterium]|nr:ABC transporter permease subunit [Acidimicrobiia bacterium]